MLDYLELSFDVKNIILDYLVGDKVYWKLQFDKIIYTKFCKRAHVYYSIQALIHMDNLKIDYIKDYYTKKYTHRLKCHISFKCTNLDISEIQYLFKIVSKYCNKAHNSKNIILIKDDYVKFII